MQDIEHLHNTKLCTYLLTSKHHMQISTSLWHAFTIGPFHFLRTHFLTKTRFYSLKTIDHRIQITKKDFREVEVKLKFL